LEDDRYYSEEDLEWVEVDPVEAYDNFAHTDGYGCNYKASENTIEHFKRKYDYKRRDETDESKQYDLMIFLGYKPAFH